MEKIIAVLAAILIIYIVFRIFKALIKWVLIILVVVLAIAYFSNPDKENHLKGLRSKIENLPVKVKDDALQVDDYKVFSITKVKVKGEEKIVGFGAFGKVWYFEDIKEHFTKP